MRKTFRRITKSVVAGLIVSALSTIASAAPVVLMPLGDSITAGSDGGYRKPLLEKLKNEHGLTVTTVGSVTDESLAAGQQAHEGHPGWRIDQLTISLVGRDPGDAKGGYWIKGGHDTGRAEIKPDIVTLMAGINDLNQMIEDKGAKDGAKRSMADRSDEILSTLQTRFKAIVSALDENLPESTLLLGGCIPYNNGLLNEKDTGATDANRKLWAQQDGVSAQQEMGVNHWVVLFNSWIRDTYVPELQKAGKNVAYVDVYANFILPDGSVRGWSNEPPEKTQGPAAYADYGLHPNTFGYGLMADAWAKAIAEHIGK